MRPATTHQTLPLAIYRDTRTCDTCGHEIALWTDGTTAYALIASVNDNTGFKSGPITRDHTMIEVRCGYTPYHRTDVPCAGSAKFDLSEQHWRSGTEGGRLLLANGGPIIDETEDPPRVCSCGSYWSQDPKCPLHATTETEDN